MSTHEELDQRVDTGVGATVSGDDQREFQDRLNRAQLREGRAKVREVEGKRVIWAPQAGSQTSFLSCPFFEVLYHGTRGGGKSDALIMSFAQHVGRGHGRAWRGILFRRTYPELGDIVAKSLKWFSAIYPSAVFNQSKMTWSWPTGEQLLLRHIAVPADYWHYHGHEYPWIAFEELTTWPTDECYKPMFSCCRTSHPGVPRMIRATTNPHGIGHNWVADRFQLRGGQWRRTGVLKGLRDEDGRPQPVRCHIPSRLSENKVLLEVDPNYESTISAAARNPAMREAWLTGSWDIVAGGMFDDVFRSEFNVVPEFEIPRTWRLDRAFDWGSSKPFSVGWYAQSDGSTLVLKDGRRLNTVRGDVFRVNEWYGWTGRPNDGRRMLASDIARGIVERELQWGYRLAPGRSRVYAGPADSAIWTTENGVNIALDMGKPVRIGNTMYEGVQWTRADKRPGSRKSGWETVRSMMAAAHPPQSGGPREFPGFFVVGPRNPQFLRTIPALPRDERDPDDVDTDAEDHIADEMRYRLRKVGTEIRTGRVVGMT